MEIKVVQKRTRLKRVLGVGNARVIVPLLPMQHTFNAHFMLNRQFFYQQKETCPGVLFPLLESTLRRFCEFVQIDFQDSMINWPPPPPDQAHLFQMFAGVWRKAGETDGIAPLSENDKNKYPEPDEEMQITIDNAMPFYNFLKQAKDKADKTFKVEQCQA